ncbi:nitroreductase [Pseudoclavibacter endophyticus]|uniref:Nitroreductase n=1 Tax=Pseudoclavibacter endophyticus TaxID=1778590 RepID=A0A6H9WJM0_9MICO|nr:nitroreductase family protein [Pseudoclavibacter endophyticus]KAB1649026.1 nitroreductase [Pseudoclavibacter endophyticus]GGA66128.1 nitroreductase [Pseudoclavibacter endophyticus]
MTTPRNATTHPIAPALAERWSPRGFDQRHELSADGLRSVLEAARWSPSSGNSQPWAFAAGRRGSETYDAIASTLTGFNRVWAPRASALVAFIARTERDGTTYRWAEYDLGQSAAHATVQVEHLGLVAHQMGGFDADALQASLELGDELVPMAVMAIGAHDASDDVPEAIRERDARARSRRDLDDLLVRPLD